MLVALFSAKAYKYIRVVALHLPGTPVFSLRMSSYVLAANCLSLALYRESNSALVSVSMLTAGTTSPAF